MSSHFRDTTLASPPPGPQPSKTLTSRTVRILDLSGARTYLSQPRNLVAADVSPRHLLRSERRLAPTHVGGYEVTSLRATRLGTGPIGGDCTTGVDRNVGAAITQRWWFWKNLRCVRSLDAPLEELVLVGLADDLDLTRLAADYDGRLLLLFSHRLRILLCGWL